MNRCQWIAHSKNQNYIDYHDKEWGKPLHDDQSLFELLMMECYQTGLSWESVLNKRQAFRQVFDHYNPEKVASLTDEKLEDILTNPNIIRNRSKIYATRRNAQAFLNIQEEFTSFDAYLWSFVDFSPLVNPVENYKDVPAKTELSQRLSKDLKKRGFTFTGPVVVYAYMQAAGLVNDHEISCDYRGI